MVGNLFDPADGRVHYARRNSETISSRGPVLTRCNRDPAPDVRYDVDGPISCDDCLTLGLIDDVWAALHEWTVRNLGPRPRPGWLDVGHHTYGHMVGSRVLFEPVGPRIDDTGAVTPFGFPIREVDEDQVRSDCWSLVDDEGRVIGSGQIGQLPAAARS